jgi:methyl-accepting chemotaxis protein
MRRGGEQMAQGVAGAQETGAALSQINAGVQNVATIVHDIAAAMRDQAKATEEITLRIEQIARMAKDNSATICDANRIFQTMAEVADHLHSAVGRFRLSGDSGERVA